MPRLCENTGSAARDFAMLERNLLSHLRLAALLLLLAASVLLNARLPSSSDPSGETSQSSGRIPLASVEVAAAVVAIGAGIWEYRRGYQDMQDMKGFLTAVKYVLHNHIYAVFIILQAPFLCHECCSGGRFRNLHHPHKRHRNLVAFATASLPQCRPVCDPRFLCDLDTAALVLTGVPNARVHLYKDERRQLTQRKSAHAASIRNFWLPSSNEVAFDTGLFHETCATFGFVR